MCLKRYLFCTSLLLFSGCSDHSPSNKFTTVKELPEAYEQSKYELLGVKIAVFKNNSDGGKYLLGLNGTLSINEKGCLAIQSGNGKYILPVFSHDEVFLIRPPVWYRDKRPLLVHLPSRKIYAIGDKIELTGGNIHHDDIDPSLWVNSPDCEIDNLFMS